MNKFNLAKKKETNSFLYIIFFLSTRVPFSTVGSGGFFDRGESIFKDENYFSGLSTIHK